VIIPTRDSAVDLERCLSSLARPGVAHEAIVVDQASDDDTRGVAAAAGAIIVEVDRPKLYAPPTHSRNVGAAAASGDYLLHLDVDMTLAPTALDAAVQACRETDRVAVTLEEIDAAVGFWAECKALERRAYRRSPVLEAARFVRTTIFREVGGYDEDLGSGEDWDIHSRYAAIGSIGRVPAAVYHHLGSISYTRQLSKKFAYGRSAGNFRGKHRSARFSQAMALSYMRSWRTFAGDPAHTVGFVALRLGEVAALAAGIAVESLERHKAR
jgi:glycosyltransferase involved in cell wall biosynthesis